MDSITKANATLIKPCKHSHIELTEWQMYCINSTAASIAANRHYSIYSKICYTTANRHHNGLLIGVMGHPSRQSCNLSIRWIGVMGQ
eukprot:scaffold378059_cov24-Prasinocladus_malaysianus.AAC.1